MDDINKSFSVNVVGVFNTINKFLPLIKRGKEKKIVAISSGMGDIGKLEPVKYEN